MTTLDDAARRKANEIADRWRNELEPETIEEAFCVAMEWATEAAAKKCEAYSEALNDKDPHAYAMSAAALYCAAAIRGGKL